jgi:hypothetical protein
MTKDERIVRDIKRVSLVGAVLLLLILLFAGCDVGNVSIFGSPSQVQSQSSASPTPTPRPSPSPSPTPVVQAPSDPCLPTRAELHFHSSPSEDRSIASGQSRQLDFTPYKGEIQLPDSCNRTRFPVWSIETVKVNPLSVSTCSLSGTLSSYIPNLIASTRTGDKCIVRAVLSVASGDQILQFPAAFEADVK